MSHRIDIEDLPKFVADLVDQVAKADHLYASVHAHFQAASDKEYQDEFGHKGPHLAGFPLRAPEPLDSPDRTYVYWRHKLSQNWPDQVPDAMTALGRQR